MHSTLKEAQGNSSVGGIITADGLEAYYASKHAVEGIAAAMRDELSSMGITVQTINPGPYDTGRSAHRRGSSSRPRGIGRQVK